MTNEETISIFEKKAQDSITEAARYQLRVAMFRALEKKFEGLDLSDVDTLYAYDLTSGRFEVDFTLKTDRKDSKLVHKLAQHFGMSFEKFKHWDGESLKYRGETDGLIIEVMGAVPASCAVVEIEEPLTEEELEAARAAALAKIKPVRIRREIRCQDLTEEEANLAQ